MTLPPVTLHDPAVRACAQFTFQLQVLVCVCMYYTLKVEARNESIGILSGG